jgi:HEAT repeat protein
MVVFDDGNTILKQLTFDQPTAWLATQLKRDPDLWNREWAIEQLAQRPGDAAAMAALAEAATGADYFRTRAGAVEALAELPATSTAAPLAAALRDTSALVRRAAIAALGQLGGPRAAELARATFRTDPSYAVRAAALTALVRADSTARDSAIAWGLATPSYQDVIQEAAYRIVAQTGDTGAIPHIEALLGTDHFAAHVLAALASRGSAHALDVLAAHLNDDRRVVRRWVVEAFQFTLPRQFGIPRLQAVAGTLKYADTRKDVETVLQHLQKPGTDSE